MEQACPRYGSTGSVRAGARSEVVREVLELRWSNSLNWLPAGLLSTYGVEKLG
jgi:hypothetical protein